MTKSKDMTSDIDETEAMSASLPPKPEAPLPGDCCGSGCTPCILDLHEEEVQRWEEECRRIRLGLPASHCGEIQSQEMKTCTLQKTEYSSFTIESIQKNSHNSYIYRFRLPQGTRLGIDVGQHLILRVKNSKNNISRQYTPVSPADAVGYFEVLIKIYEGGRMSQLVKEWQVGSSAEWRGPFGELYYRLNQYRRLLMLAAGTGIAPMLQLVQHVLGDDREETLLRLVYCCRTYQDLLMKEQLDEFSSYWNFSVLYVLSQDTPEMPSKIKYGDTIHYGHFSQEDFTNELGEDKSDTLVLICGTKSFDKDMIRYAQEVRIEKSNIFKF